MSELTLFQKIDAGEIPAEKIHDDDQAFAINDINPQAPVHVLVIPKKPLKRISVASESDQLLLGHLLLTAAKLARELELTEGYRIVINNGKHGGESVPHLHVHLLGSRQMTWPPG